MSPSEIGIKDVYAALTNLRSEVLEAIGAVGSKVNDHAVGLARLEERLEAHERLPSHPGTAAELKGLQKARNRLAGAAAALSTAMSIAVTVLLEVVFR